MGKRERRRKRNVENYGESARRKRTKAENKRTIVLLRVPGHRIRL